VDDAQKLAWRSPQVLKDEFGVDFYSGTVSDIANRLSLPLR
jgi:hypothetical protein